MEIRRALTPPRGWLPGAAAGLVALATLASFWAIRRDLGQNGSQRSADAAAAAAAAAIQTRLSADGVLLDAAAGALVGDPTKPVGKLESALASVSTPESPPLGVAVAGPDGVTLSTVAPAGSEATLAKSDLRTRPEWRVALGVATDNGRPLAQAATDAAGRTTVLIARPLFGSLPGPSDVAGRRAQLAGYVVLFETPDSLARTAFGTARPGVAAQIAQGQTILETLGAGPGARAPASASSSPISSDGLTWTVTVWATRSRPALPWVVLVVGLVLAGIVGAAFALNNRASRRMAETAMARADELGLVARAGPLLQQSLDLGDLLPLFVVQLSDELGLDGIGISLRSETGQLVRAFSFGASVPGALEDLDPIPRVPASVPPGGRLTLPLLRAGRAVGVLSARARLGLHPSQMQALQAAADLLAAALGNVRLFQQEQEMVKRLRDLDRMKTTFLGSVSHELRTSVTAIAGFADLLASQLGTLDPQLQADFLDRINRNAKSLSLLVDDLLDFARLERSAMSVSLGPVDLSDLVPKVIAQMSSILQHHTVSDTLTPGVVVMADATAVERVLINLLSNAAKYTPQGTEVAISLEREASNAVLTVADEGPGIPPDERERVFDLFYRVDNSPTRAARGVGIGLALARQLVGLLHGEVDVDEAPGGGASFRVQLPLITEEIAESGVKAAPSALPG